MTPDPKPRKRYKATEKEIAEIRMHILDNHGVWCPVCGWRMWHDLHHAVPRAQGGDDYAVNYIEVCRLCHEALHNRSFEHRAKVREILYRRPASHGYVVQRKSQEWLDRNYPGEA